MAIMKEVVLLALICGVDNTEKVRVLQGLCHTCFTSHWAMQTNIILTRFVVFTIMDIEIKMFKNSTFPILSCIDPP